MEALCVPALRLCNVEWGEPASFFRVYAAELPPADAMPRGQQHRISHRIALDLLSAVLAEDFGIYHVRLTRDANGKPQLLHPTLHVNLSHCAGLTVCAVGNLPLGIDAEPPRVVRARMLDRICTEEERDCILHAIHPSMMFSRLWTLKEAYAKWHGGGIRLPMQTLSFSFGVSPPTIIFRHPDAEKVDCFQLLLEFHNVQYAVSICCASKPIQREEIIP